MQESKSFQHAFGHSVEDREQLVHTNFDPARTGLPAGLTLLIGGMHGDEIATVLLLQDFVKRHLPALREPTAVIPICNPDGYLCGSRYNARGVDLNRNCGFNWREDSVEPSGPAPWSEPEICALRNFILTWRPTKIVSLHWALAEIDADGHHSTALAQAMWQSLSRREQRPYRLRVTEAGSGQRRLENLYTTCPGSLGQWCGYALEYHKGVAPAMITLELPYDPTVESRPDDLPTDHLQYLHTLWERDSAGYLRAIEGPVRKMLLAACRFR